VCGDPWPCQPAQTYLRATMSPVALSIYAGCQLGDALVDLKDVDPRGLWDRFLGWTRS
jgi:hypothetical protein